MKYNVVIRNAREDDIGRIVEIEAVSLSLWNERQFIDELKNPRSTFLVAELEGRIAGYIAARRVLDETEILIIAAAPEVRRRGIASELLDTALNRMFSGTCGTVYLEVGERNAAARSFYMSRGFHEAGRRPGYYHEDSAVIMVRDYEGKSG